jgi:hypothetical protein
VIIVDNPNQKYKYCTKGAILHTSATEAIRQFEAALSRSRPVGSLSAGYYPFSPAQSFSI